MTNEQQPAGQCAKCGAPSDPDYGHVGDCKPADQGRGVEKAAEVLSDWRRGENVQTETFNAAIDAAIAALTQPKGDAEQLVDELIEAAVSLETAEASKCYGDSTESHKARLKNARRKLTTALSLPRQSEAEPLGWIHEDDLPDGYPYDAMFPFSKVDGVRMFPVFAPVITEDQP